LSCSLYDAPSTNSTAQGRGNQPRSRFLILSCWIFSPNSQCLQHKNDVKS
jgi:hypothetical protein